MMAKGIPSSLIWRCSGVCFNSYPATTSSVTIRPLAEISRKWSFLPATIVLSNTRFIHSHRKCQTFNSISDNASLPVTPAFSLCHAIQPRKYVPERRTPFPTHASTRKISHWSYWSSKPWQQQRLYSGGGSGQGNGSKCSCGKDITGVSTTPAKTTEDLERVKASTLNETSKDAPSQLGKQDPTGSDSEPVSYMSYLHLPRMPHRPTKEELLEAANGFWQRLKVRLKWVSIRSMRPWNIDEWGAFVSWFLFGHLAWIIVGTTTFFSLIILSINTVVAQGMVVCLARRIYMLTYTRNTRAMGR